MYRWRRFRGNIGMRMQVRGFEHVLAHICYLLRLDAIEGLQYIDHLCVEDGNRSATLLAVANKYVFTANFPLRLFADMYLSIVNFFRYYALSASSAVFKYTETKLNTRYAPKSLCITYTPVEGTMLIDTETVKNLEIVSNNTNRKSKQSLYGCVLGHLRVSDASACLYANLLPAF